MLPCLAHFLFFTQSWIPAQEPVSPTVSGHAHRPVSLVNLGQIRVMPDSITALPLQLHHWAAVIMKQGPWLGQYLSGRGLASCDTHILYFIAAPPLQKKKLGVYHWKVSFSDEVPLLVILGRVEHVLISELHFLLWKCEKACLYLKLLRAKSEISRSSSLGHYQKYQQSPQLQKI